MSRKRPTLEPRTSESYLRANAVAAAERELRILLTKFATMPVVPELLELMLEAGGYV